VAGVRTGQNMKKVALTQRGKDSGGEGPVPLMSCGGLGWLQASWTPQNLAERDVENRAALRDQH